MKQPPLSQSGNALWFILIAITLLGGLTVMLCLGKFFVYVVIQL